MVSPRTLRRKLQKKLKHKPYRRCPRCGDRMYVRFVPIDSAPGLVGPETDHEDVLVKECYPCKLWVQLFWLGGGTGRHIPHGLPKPESPAGERPVPDDGQSGCAGSNPAPTTKDKL